MYIRNSTDAVEAQRIFFNNIRGGVVSNFAQAEFTLKDFLVGFARKNNTEEIEFYSHKIEKVLENFEGVVRSITAECDAQIQLIENVNAYAQAIRDRNLFVHGIAVLDSEQNTVVLRRYIVGKGNDVKIDEQVYNLENIEENARIFDGICRQLIADLHNLANRLQFTLTVHFDVRDHSNDRVITSDISS